VKIIFPVENSLLKQISITIIVGIFTISIWMSILISMQRTAQAKEYALDIEQTSYDDLLDALRLSLKGYEIE